MTQVNHNLDHVESSSKKFGFLRRFVFWGRKHRSRQSQQRNEGGADIFQQRDFYESGGLNEAFIVERWASYR